MDLKLLGIKLRCAREDCGLTQQVVAEFLGVSRTTIVHFEAGDKDPSTRELSLLAKLFCRSVRDLIPPDEEIQEDDALVAMYRAALDLESNIVLREEVSRCVEICREGFRLRNKLGKNLRAVLPHYKMPIPQNTAEAIDQGSLVAERERRRLDLGTSPIADMAEHLATQGVWPAGAMLPDEISGLFLHHSSIGIVILVNHEHGPNRKQFSYAHEYGHALIDRHQGGGVTRKQNAQELIEQRANAFAAAFLMPRRGVESLLEMFDKGAPSRQDLPVYDVGSDSKVDTQRRPVAGSQEITPFDVARLASHFHVSYLAQTYRLRSLNLITTSECKQLVSLEEFGRAFQEALGLREKTQEWKRKEEKGGRKNAEQELVSQIVYLALEACRRNEMTAEEALNLFKRLDVLNAKQLARLAKTESEA